MYDNQGNLLRDGTASYSYDSFNRLVKAETAEDGSIIRYIRGKRLISSDNEKARCYYHYASDEMGSITHIIEDAVKRKLAEERSASDKDGVAQDASGARIVNRYEYDAFGNTVACDETLPNRFRFAGEQYDQITQQYYLRARFYNPVIGRFLQEDDYYGDGLNLYAYCRNNPVNYVDPSGHGTESAPDKWAENNRKDIQDLVDEMNHGNGASPSDVEAIKSLAKEFGLDPSEFDVKSSQEVNQQALKDLVNEVNKAGGASPSDQKILKEFAEEYGMDYDSLGVKEAGGGTGKGESETKTTNTGKEIDVTPEENHSTRTNNPGPYGEANSSVDILDENGKVKTRRWYDGEGHAYRDVDMTNHGNSKEHPEWPHEHTWDWGTGKPIRN